MAIPTLLFRTLVWGGHRLFGLNRLVCRDGHFAKSSHPGSAIRYIYGDYCLAVLNSKNDRVMVFDQSYTLAAGAIDRPSVVFLEKYLSSINVAVYKRCCFDFWWNSLNNVTLNCVNWLKIQLYKASTNKTLTTKYYRWGRDYHGLGLTLNIWFGMSSALETKEHCLDKLLFSENIWSYLLPI